MLLLHLVFSACLVMGQATQTDATSTEVFQTTTSDAGTTGTGVSTDLGAGATTTGTDQSPQTTVTGNTETISTAVTAATSTSTDAGDGEEDPSATEVNAETAETELPIPALAEVAPEYVAYSEDLLQRLEGEKIAPIMNEVFDYYTPAAELTVTNTPTAINAAATEPTASILSEFSAAAANTAAATGTTSTTTTAPRPGNVQTGGSTSTTTRGTSSTSSRTTTGSSGATGTAASVPSGNDASQNAAAWTTIVLLGLSLAILS